MAAVRKRARRYIKRAPHPRFPQEEAALRRLGHLMRGLGSNRCTLPVDAVVSLASLW